MLESITPLILTFDEEVNIGRVLDRLRWAGEIVVVDSGSTDNTRNIVASFPNARFVVRPFDNHANQWNFGLHESGIRSEWVLALDADYILDDDFVEALRKMNPEPEDAGFRASFRYCVFGRRLRGTLYPPVVVLYRRGRARYFQSGHTQRVKVDGAVGVLDGSILHDDHKPLARWLAAQDRYARLEAAVLRTRPWAELGWVDRLRCMHVVTPPLTLVYCLVVKLGLLDGAAGLYYAFQRMVAEVILSLVLLEQRLAPKSREPET